MTDIFASARGREPIRLSEIADFSLGELRVRPALREVERGGAREQLEPRVMQVLVALGAAEGAVLSRDDLIARCWEGRIVGEAAINRCISLLREIAERSGAFTIETIPRVGYRLISSTPTVRPPGETGTKVPASAAPTARYRRKLPYLWAAVVLIAATALVMTIYQSRVRPPASPAPSASSVQASIAVLPFKNLSSDKDTGYLADGVQDEVLTRLAKIGSLRVISRTSTEEFASHVPNVREVARKLGVANVLEGNVQKSGNRIRINVQLIRAVDDDHLWAEDYDRNLDDVLSVESDVAGTIARVLAAKMTPHERAEIAARPTDNPRAYDLFLRGVVFARTDDNTSQQTALQLFQQAVGEDPKFAVAWAWLARMQALGHTGEDPASVRRSPAYTALTRALQLRPDLPEVQVAKGYYLYYGELNYPAAEREFERVHARWPNNADALEALALVLRRLGKWKESTDALTRLVSLDPLVPMHRTILAWNFVTTHDFADAQRVLDDALKIWPDNSWFLATKASAFQEMGQLEQADAALKNVHPAPDDTGMESVIWEQFWLKRQFGRCAAYFKGVLDQVPDADDADVTGLLRTGVGECLRMAGDARGARECYGKARNVILAGLKGRPKNTDYMTWLAVDYSGLGDSTKAMATINQAIEFLRASNHVSEELEALGIRAQVMAASGDRGASIAEISRLIKLSGDPTPAMLRLDPTYDRLRGDPRFEALAHSDRVKAN